jgi:TonB family protein
MDKASLHLNLSSKTVYLFKVLLASVIIFTMLSPVIAQQKASSQMNLPDGWRLISEKEAEKEVIEKFTSFKKSEPKSDFFLVVLEEDPEEWFSGNKFWSLGDWVYDYTHSRKVGFARRYSTGNSPVTEENNRKNIFKDNGEFGPKQYTVVDVQPLPIGGMKAFFQYISKNIKYPKEARKERIQGRVYVQFVVDKDGTIIDVEVIQGIGGGCDEEAIRLMNESPKWSPGIVAGRAVKVRMIMPITFRL